MARPIWSGVITFGLVTVPVRLVAAVRDRPVRFHRLQRGTGDRVRDRRVNERTGERVGHEDVVRGYDPGDGAYVVAEPEELEGIAPGRAQVIEVRGFVGLDAVEPAYYGDAYYLVPGSEEHSGVYELLRTALRDSAKAGVATFVMHGREYLVALRAGADVLELHTLHRADEVRDPRRELPRPPGAGRPAGRELESARRLIDAMSVEWRPEDYADTYETKVRRLVRAKRRGEEVAAEAGPPEATDAADLEDALRSSVDRAARAGSRAGPPSGSGEGAEGAEAGDRAAGAEDDGGDDRLRVLSDMSKRDLYERATERNVPGRSRMNRRQLIRALGDGRPRRRTAS